MFQGVAEAIGGSILSFLVWVLMFSVFSFVCDKLFGDCNSPQKKEKPRIILFYFEWIIKQLMNEAE